MGDVVEHDVVAPVELIVKDDVGDDNLAERLKRNPVLLHAGVGMLQGSMGVHGALQNGLPCVGVTWGYGTQEELLTAGAFALADEPADVVDLVLAPYRSDERP